MKVTVIVCTYNRSQSLARALASVADSIMPEDMTWEVLVIDNNSSDNTRAVVQDLADRYPRIFRYVFEAKPGKSNALNRALRETDADVLAFMDDDVRVEPDWLCMLTRIFADPRYSGSGGRIVPDSAFTLPIWLGTSERYALAPLAMFDLGLEAGELKEPPFGTNMAFRREMFTRYGDFRRDLGPQPGSEIRSEDTEFGMRVLGGGERLWYEPAAVVHHSVPQTRVKKSYFLAWWYGKGRGDIRESDANIDFQRNKARFSLVLIRRMIVWTLRWLFTFNPAQRFSCQAKVWWLSGKLRETFVESRRTVVQPLSEPRSAQ
ncbi:MAG: glycosyltransferase family 2 protein [Terracidiphilus sp.]